MGDNAIGVLRLVLFKGGEELFKYLTLSLASILNSRVLGGIILAHHVLVVKVSVAVGVENIEGSVDESLAHRVQISSYLPEEFVILDRAIAVDIKGCKQFSDIIYGHVKLALLTALRKLVEVEGFGVIIVHDSEDTTDSNNRFGSAEE